MCGISSDRCSVAELLKPLRPGASPALRDRDAAAPRWVPTADELSSATRALLARASTLQGMLFAERRRALLFVLQGRDASGKDGLLRKVFTALHPQGLKVSSFGVPTQEEASHDFLWRQHRELPAFGQVAVWNRSHYEDVLIPRVHRTLPPRVWTARYDRINEFETQIRESGIHVVKLFIHISGDEQLSRFKDRASDRARQWKVQPSDLRDRAAWPRFTRAYRDIMLRCNSKLAPWYIVPSNAKPVRDFLVASLLVHQLERLKPVPPPADPGLLKAVASLK